MAIYEEITTQMKIAMKARDKPRTQGLRNIRAALIAVAKETGAERLDDGACQTILRRLAKQRKESIEAYEQGGRKDLVAEECAELGVIEAFLPKLADEASTREWVASAITSSGATSPKDMGRVMGVLMKNHKAELDGKLANTIVRELLGQ
jgi:uncharacterized protein YqeY